MTERLTLSPRLAAAASLIRDGAFVSDVGTDHAYLPIALCLHGRARGGVVSDINAGPIERARENIKRYGLEDRLCAVQANGLTGIDRYAPEDIMILGMGGELIASILEAAEWTRKESLRLCLQPMTHPEHLRAFLACNGYAVIDERIAREDDKIYQVILAEYSGRREEYSEEELLLGRINIERGGEDLLALADHHVAVLSRRVKGIESAGGNAADVRSLIEKINTAKCKGGKI